MIPIQVTVPGDPVAKGRPRFTRAGHTYTPAKTREWEKQARWYAKEAMQGRRMITGPVTLNIVATFQLPPSWPKWKQEAALDDKLYHTGKPDGDNVAKALKDALNGIVYTDDAQVFSHSMTKRYGTIPGVFASIQPIGGLCTQTKYKPQDIGT